MTFRTAVHDDAMSDQPRGDDDAGTSIRPGTPQPGQPYRQPPPPEQRPAAPAGQQPQPGQHAGQYQGQQPGMQPGQQQYPPRDGYQPQAPQQQAPHA